jgi:hypothetical protein
MSFQNAPLATPDQIEVERRALRLLERSDVQKACARVADHWISKLQPNAEHRACFEAEYAQAAFCGLMNTVNADPERPRIHAFGRLEHELDGLRVPATKSGHPNPDYIYRFMPVDGTSRYVIRGQLPACPPTAFELSLLTHDQIYLKNISIHELVTDADGSFMLTIDPDPDGGRPNHFRTVPDVHQMLIRDVIGDLDHQRPVALEAERLGFKPLSPAPADDDLAAVCERHIRKHVDDLLWVNDNLVRSREINTFETPAVHKGGVYSVSQAYSAGHYRLTEDEALIFRLTLGNARYAVVPVSNRWGGLGLLLDHQVTLSTGRATANPDGSYVFVAAHRDPGIHNWVDPAGLHEGVIFVRWAGFDPSLADRGPPTLDTKLVRLSDLATTLPPDTPKIDLANRQTQLAQRRKSYVSLMS